MNKYSKIASILQSHRQCGRTYFAERWAKVNNGVLIVKNSFQANLLRKQGIKAETVEDIDSFMSISGFHPSMLEHFAAESLLFEAGKEIDELKWENEMLKKKLHLIKGVIDS